MRKRNTLTNDLRNELSKALRTGRYSEALALYELIQARKPDEPRWPHRKGELLARMGRRDEAVSAFRRAIDLYATKGFLERAVATAKVMLSVDPTQAGVLEQLEDQATRELQRPSLTSIHARPHPRR